MSTKLSTTAKCTRISMIAVIVMFLALGLMQVPAMNLETAEFVIAWLVILAACLQFAVAAILAPRLSNDQPLGSPLILSQVVGLAFFGGALYAGTQPEGTTPEQLRLILMLGVNCLAAASLAGIALSPMTPTEPQEIVEDA